MEFLENYGGNACISIDGYCEEVSYDFSGFAEEEYCIKRESWWNEIKDREIKTWNIIGGGYYPVELTISLK